MVKHSFRFLLAATLLLACSVHPAGAGEPKAEVPTARVQGQGAVWAKPDVAQLIFVIETEALKVPEAADANARQADGFLAAVKKLLSSADSLQSLSYRVDPVYAAPEKGKRPKITGYKARHTFRVRLTDLKKVGEVIDAGLANGASQVQGPRWEHAKLDELTRQAAVQALTRARQLAEALAAAEKLKVKRLQLVSTQFHGPPMPRAAFAVAGGVDEGAPTPLEVGEEEIRSQVEAVFELE
jgi:hypothetical protein